MRNRMIKTPKNEIFSRVERLKNLLIENQIDCAFIMHNVGLYYFAGTAQDAILLVPAEGDPLLFVRRTLLRAMKESPIPSILGFKSMKEIHGFISDSNLKVSTIGLEMDVLPARFYVSLGSLFQETRFVDVSASIRTIRAVKSGFECSLLEEGGRRFDRVFSRIREEIRPGRTEYDVSMKLIQFLMQEGSSLIVRTRAFNMETFPKHILCGATAARHSSMDSPSGGGDGISFAFPSGAGYNQLAPGLPILVDALFNYEGYIVDCTRIFAIGDLDPIYRHAHEVSGACHRLFIEKTKPGAFIPDIFTSIWDLVRKEKLEAPFMGGVKFIGHGVGLELDEFPVIAQKFEGYIHEGMVIALEPKFVFPGGAVGFENTYIIEERGPRSITNIEESIQYL